MSEEITWCSPFADGYIVLQNAVFNRISEYRQVRSGDREAGGLLLGYRRGRHFEVADATTPLRRDRRKRTFFDRCDPGHERYALKRWSDTARTMDYLGEWHTHPESSPTPSFHDIKEWRVLLVRRQAPLLFLIVGTRDVWMGCGNATSIRMCAQ